jgi:hypothetical protein
MMPQLTGSVFDSYPLYVNIWKRDVMDSHRETTVGIEKPTPNDKALHLEALPDVGEGESKSAEAGHDVQVVHN